MSIVRNLAHATLQTIASELQMQEIGSSQEPFKVLRSPMAVDSVGSARVFKGSNSEQLIYIGLTVPMIHLDSHMVFCFTGKESLVPHFTVDAVKAGDHYAFHLDLIPRVDLAVNLSYMQTSYQALTNPFKLAKNITSLTEAQLSPMQLAVMSPWMLAHRATAEAMDSVGVVCSQYLAHWLNLYKSGLTHTGDIMGQNPAQRDGLHRSVLFSRDVDPVWLQIERLLGLETSEELRGLLIGSV